MIIEDEGDKQKLKKQKNKKIDYVQKTTIGIKQFIHLLKIRILKILRYSRMFDYICDRN